VRREELSSQRMDPFCSGAGASVEKREQRCGKNQYIHMVK